MLVFEHISTSRGGWICDLSEGLQDTANHKKWRQGYGDDRVTAIYALLYDVGCVGRRLGHPGGGEV